MLSLGEWENFCVIIGTSAGALTGLMFVVIALGSDRRSLSGAAELHAFATPTVIHFCGVLLVTALLSMPHQTATGLGWCLGAVGLAGLVMTGLVVAQARRGEYRMVAADWLWHVGLPLVGYACVLTSAVTLPRQPTAALQVVAYAVLLQLFVGIHNAWDAAVFLATQPRKDQPQQERPTTPGSS